MKKMLIILFLGLLVVFPAQAQIQITQSTDTTTVTSLNSVACSNFFGHADNSYIRRFDLDGDHGLAGQFDVTSVDFGVEVARSAGGGGQPLTVNLYTIPNGAPLTPANATLIGTASNATFPDAELSIVNMPVTGTVADVIAQDLVVEIFTPNGQAAGHAFFVGSNANGQIAPSYLVAPSCGATEATDIADLGFPDMHIVMIVNLVRPGARSVVSGWVFGESLANLVQQLGLGWWPGKNGDPPSDVGVEVNVGDPFSTHNAPAFAAHSQHVTVSSESTGHVNSPKPPEAVCDEDGQCNQFSYYSDKR